MTNSEILMVVFTAVIALTGVLGAIIFNGQLTAMQAQLGEMKTASVEVKRQSDAAERSSTAGRAYLFVKYETPQAAMMSPATATTESDDVTTFKVPIRYSIKNLGQTPAIITKVEAHLLINKDGSMITEPPHADPPEALEMKESSRMR